MKTKLHFATVTIVMVAFIFSSALFSETSLNANNTGAPAMRTGSPGDTKSCTTCHSGTAQQVTGIITSNIPPTGYIPGVTYIIEAVCNDPLKTRFGFQISPQNITGAKLGVITITDAARTKLVGSGKYVTHTSAGTAGSGSIMWSFNWTAPPAGTGDVSFYGAFNFSNHNNAASGDLIKLSQLTASEDLNTFVKDFNINEPIAIYPNPVKDFLNIDLPENLIVEKASIYDINGRAVHLKPWNQQKGRNEIDLSDLNQGTYYVSFVTEKGIFSSKLIKQ